MCWVFFLSVVCGYLADSKSMSSINSISLIVFHVSFMLNQIMLRIVYFYLFCCCCCKNSSIHLLYLCAMEMKSRLTLNLCSIIVKYLFTIELYIVCVCVFFFLFHLIFILHFIILYFPDE